LPFALWPLIRFTSDKQLMGPFTNTRLIQATSWGLFGLIPVANLTLMWFWVA